MIKPALITRALAIVGTSPANREYFFANLHSPDWLKPLRDAGRFKHPVAAVRDKGSILFVPWPESAYLARMAGVAPELVRDIILETEETDNERVHQDFVEAAIKMPAQPAADVARFEAEWIRKQPWLYTLYPEKVGELVSHLAKQGKTEAGVHLARELLTVVPPPISEDDADDSFKLPPEPRGKCQQWEYQRVLSTHVPDLVRAAPDRSLRLLYDLLQTGLRIRCKGQQDATEDYSWIWRPNIASKNFDNILEALVSATRDAVVAMSISPETTATAAKFLWLGKWRTFRRLAAYVLDVSPTAPMQYIEEVVTDPLEYDDFPNHSPEFDKLLSDKFAALSDLGKIKVLSFIESGPDLTAFKKRRELEGTPAKEEEVADVADYWRLQWLHRIRADLPVGWHDKYALLVERHGEPQTHIGTGVHTWVGPTSPRSSEELKQMTGEQLIEFLRSWRSTGEWNGPSPEGLGRSLSSMVGVNPQTIAANATLLCGLDPTYIRSAIEGFTSAVKNRQSFDWTETIALCEWAVAQGNDIKVPDRNVMENDPDWNWARKSIARYLKEALQVQGETALPLSLRLRVWRLLEVLAGDPVATEEGAYARGVFFGSNSLNVTRGVALDGMLEYARWLEKRSALPPRETRTIDSIPELKRALESHIAQDNSVATREVFGRNFPTLFWLDKEWAAKTVPKIFGKEEGALGEVAWGNYLLFHGAYNELLPILVDFYKDSIDRIGRGLHKEVEDIDRHLAEHLMIFYWRGTVQIDSDDRLIRAFFHNAPPALRSHAIEFIGRNLHNAAPVEHEILSRLKALWEWRIAELRQLHGDSEGIPFGIWFASGQFDLDWSFKNLLCVLRICHKAELDFWVVERLATVARERPAAAAQALGMMVEGDREGWAMHGWGDHPRNVLEAALRSGDEHAKREAERVIHLLGSRGWYGYRDLLRRT